MSRSDWHRMGGPADKPLPLLLRLMPEGSVWRGFHHGKQVDIGDITVLNHRAKGLELYLMETNIRVMYPWPADDKVVIDRHQHIRIMDKSGKVKLTLAHNSPE